MLNELSSRRQVSNIGCVVQWRPPVCIYIVDICVAVFDYRGQRLGFASFRGQHCLVDGSFIENALSVVNLVSAIH
jgi:hypothetical protein